MAGTCKECTFFFIFASCEPLSSGFTVYENKTKRNGKTDCMDERKHGISRNNWERTSGQGNQEVKTKIRKILTLCPCNRKVVVA